MQQRMKELNCVDVTPPDSPVTDDPVKSKRFLAKPESLDSLAYSDSELSWKNVYTDANSNNTKVRERKKDIDCVRNKSYNLFRRFPNFLIRGFCRQRKSQTRPTTGLVGGESIQIDIELKLVQSPCFYTRTVSMRYFTVCLCP